MAIRYVDAAAGGGGNGTEGSPWNSLITANQNCSAGDTIRVKPGTYADNLRITKQNTIWEAFNPASRPVIDGGYNIGMRTGAFTGRQNTMGLPVNSNNGISMNATGVTINGFVVQNIQNDGIVIGASGATIKNTTVFFTYANGILSNNVPGGCSDVLIEDVQVFMASIRFLAGPTGGGPQGDAGKQGSALMLLGDMRSPLTVRRFTGGYGFGEGLDIDKGSIGTEQSPLLFEDITLYDTNHTTLYFNRTRWVILRNFVCYYTDVGNTIHGGAGGSKPLAAGPTLRIKDETDEIGVPSRDLFIYNGLLVNGGSLLEWGGNSGGTNMNSGARTTNTRNTYIGAITGVVGPNAKEHQINIGANTGFSQEGILENFIIDNAYGSSQPLSKITGTVNVTSRNNNWHTNPVNYHQNTTNVIGNPRLANPTKLLVTTGYPNVNALNYSQFAAANNFNANDYKLTSSQTPGQSSPGINNGSTAGSASGTTVPSLARSQDYGKKTRQGVPDIGAWEYGGGDTPPTGTLTANFTHTPSGGNAGTSIAFTNTSTTTGSAAISSRLWDFGDGTTSTANNPTKVYNTPGSYVVRLLIQDATLGISSEKLSNPIIITSPPTAGAGGVVFGQVRLAVPTTSPATVNVTSAEMGTIVPTSARVYISKATANDTAVNGEFMSVGWVTGGQQAGDKVPDVRLATSIKHNSAVSVANTFNNNGQIATYTDPDTGAFGSVTFNNWIAGGFNITFNSSAPPSPGFLMTVIFAGGPQYSASIMKVIPGNVGIGSSRIGPTFVADTARFMTSGANSNQKMEGSFLSFGYAHKSGAMVAVSRFSAHGINPTIYTESLLEGEVARQRITDDTYSILRINSFNDFGVVLEVLENPMPDPVYMMFEAYGDSRSAVGIILAQAAANTLGWQPGHVEHLMTWKNGASLGTNNKAGTFGFHTKTPSLEYTNLISGRHNISPSDCQTITVDKLLVVNNTGAVTGRGTTAFSGTGYAFAWESGPVDNYIFPYLAVEVGKETGGGVVTANFVAAPREGFAPLTVQFTNLSSAGATSFLWDFGDGETSTEANPAHVYGAAGTYRVSLIARNGPNESLHVENSYIVAHPPEERTAEPYIEGPYKFVLHQDILSPITHDLLSDPKAGTVELPLGNIQDVIYLRERETTPPVRPGYSAMWVDLATKSLRIVMSDGSPVSGSPGDIGGGSEPTPGSFSGGITAGNMDGEQDGAAMDISSPNININTTSQYGAFIWVTDIPNTGDGAADIVESYINFNISNVDFSSPDVILRGEAVDNAALLTTAANDITNRTRTDAAVVWQATGLGSGGKNTPDISTILREITSRPGYAPGNRICIIVEPASAGTLLRVKAEEGTGDTAVLHANYVTYG